MSLSPICRTTAWTELAKTAAYGVLNLGTLGRGVPRTICGERLRFPARWCRWYSSDYEPSTFAFLRRHCSAGATVIDIGAHLGLFSVLMARLVGPAGRVFSFEPTPLTRRVLGETVRLNGVGRTVVVRPEAVADQSGHATFYDTGTIASNANSLVPTSRSRTAVAIETVSLDDFVAERGLSVSCLKIDAEGAELDVLRGATKILCERRPAIALSLHPRAFHNAAETLEDIWALVNEYGYLVRLLEGYHRHSDTTRVDKHWFCEQQEIFDVELLSASSLRLPVV